MESKTDNMVNNTNQSLIDNFRLNVNTKVRLSHRENKFKFKLQNDISLNSRYKFVTKHENLLKTSVYFKMILK